MRILSRKCLISTWSTFNRISYNSSLNTKRLCCTKPALLQSIKRKVDPFGKLLINLPFRVEIKPTDHHEYPDMDTLLVNLFSSGSSPMDKAEIVSVDVASVCNIRTIDPEIEPTNDISCIIQAPVGYDVDVQTSGEGDVVLCDMVSNTINVQTEYGNIMASKLQGKEISLSASEGGSITLCKSIQGDIEINTAKDGIVNAEKCLGTRLDVSTESGDINIGSNYCEEATFSTLDGNLLLNNLHMNSSVDIHGKGSLNITCLDGSIRANLHEGSAKIQVVRITDNSSLQSSGEVYLNVPEDIDAKLRLSSNKSLDIDPNITGTYSKDAKQFTSDSISAHEFQVETEEVIQVARSNWMESLKLGKCSK